jgi:RsiW-degrading membrane proteinase PrsW (M82 family)
VLYNNKNFNEPFDGIVYAVIVSMGFATIENIIYVFQYGFATGILRLFTAVPAHAAFGILMGYFLGKAKFTHGKSSI